MTPKTLTAGYVRSLIPRRPLNSYKGKNGHVLLVAGSRGMTGAAILSGLGALKVGAGLLTIALPESARRVVAGRFPEAMIIPQAIAVIQAYVRRRTITTIAIGPGLSVHSSVARLVKRLIHMDFPIVLDADGLNNIRPADLRGALAVITPHEGELARLLGTTVGHVHKDRVTTVAYAAKKLGVVCVLKGRHTLISDGSRVSMNPTGNPAMAIGGMGDVLTGIIAGLMAQGLSRWDAACGGVYLHGLAGDLERISDRGLLPTELAARVPYALKKLGIK